MLCDSQVTALVSRFRRDSLMLGCDAQILTTEVRAVPPSVDWDQHPCVIFAMRGLK